MLPIPESMAQESAGQPAVRIRVGEGHPWRPPFGLQRVGRPLLVTVEIAAVPEPAPEYLVIARRGAQELGRHTLALTGQSPSTGRLELNPWPDEIILVAKPAAGAAVELARESWDPPAFEAAAFARPDQAIHPVDLGCILVPSDWLLLRADQTGFVEGTALCRTRDVPDAHITTWFESAPTDTTLSKLEMVQDRPASFRLPLPPVPTGRDRDTLHVRI